MLINRNIPVIQVSTSELGHGLVYGLVYGIGYGLGYGLEYGLGNGLGSEYGLGLGLGNELGYRLRNGLGYELWSCVDKIYTLRTIIHNCLEYHIPLYINFVDFKAAFDYINREYIWKAFEHYGLPGKYIRIFKALFNGTVSAVRHNNKLSSWFDVSSGTGQGDIQGHPSSTYVLTWLHNVSR